MESLVTLALTGTKCIKNRQTDKQTFFFIYIDRLAEVPGVARESSIIIYAFKTPIGLENM